tara:strand:+ start:12517 stop:12705 length:189 start_codon:yes stop_codon:yes gene_type:complete
MSSYRFKKILRTRQLCQEFDEWHRLDPEKAKEKLNLRLENKRNIFQNTVKSMIRKQHPGIDL